jgi:uncharacterized protein
MSAAPTKPWALSRNGHAIDLLNPSPADVDFAEIADTLAHVYRWTGAARVDVSVAYHTLLGVEIAQARNLDACLPWWLLHDAHEARIGDIATPIAHALDQVAPPPFSGMFLEFLQRIKRRHDAAIYTAAHLGAPTETVRQMVKQIDTIALMTERRDFLPDSPHSWGALEGVQPHSRVCRQPPAPAICAERLLALFKTHLPVFTGAHPAGA